MERPFEYFEDEQLEEVKLELERQHKEIERKLASIAIEEARRDDKDIKTDNPTG